MNPVSLLPAVGAVVSAILTTYLIAKRFGAPPSEGRFVSIDGLRGYLAFFVFIHHSCIWYFYLRTGQWRAPPSNVYTHFGQSSVALFFMITGFLFFSKILDGRTRQIDWLKIFVSRFLRLVPLYIFAIILLLALVAILSKGDLNQPISQLLKGIMHWLGFTIFRAPDLNFVEDTSLIVAKVTWSLPYEWFFYFSLPVLALPVRVVPPLPYIVLGVVGATSFAIWHPQLHHLLAFLGGIFASLLVRIEAFRNLCAHNICSFMVIALITIAVTLFPSANDVMPIMLLSCAFVLISGGNSVFKILTNNISRTLGEMAYSIYLLHGITLFVLFKFVIGVNDAKLLSAQQHWTLVIGLTPLLIFFSYCTFQFIERPPMQVTNSVTIWLRSRATWRSF